jgi:hypothetical protein
MKLENELDENPTQVPDPTAEQIHFHSRDWLLCNVVEMLNGAEEKISFGVTLMVNGLIVSGNLIGGKEYFERYGEFWAANFGAGENADKMREYFAGPASLYGAEGTGSGDPSFIHLKDAKAFMSGGSPIPNNQGVLWRGKISSVDAFYFGNLMAGD